MLTSEDRTLTVHKDCTDYHTIAIVEVQLYHFMLYSHKSLYLAAWGGRTRCRVARYMPKYRYSYVHALIAST